MGEALNKLFTPMGEFKEIKEFRDTTVERLRVI
jgi:hypothetical protein